MSATTASVQNLATRPSATGHSAHANLLLQRKCACGAQAASLTGECAQCKGRKRLQTRLAIGPGNDPLEQEADRVADQVLGAPASPVIASAKPRIQRFAGPPGASAATAPASVEHVLAGPGAPLAPALQQDMEQRFGHDFSKVRVHADAASEVSARDVHAHAYTVGQKIVFGASRFAPETPEGRRLIAHELTHVVQQSGADDSHGGLNTGSVTLRRQPARLDDCSEWSGTPLTPRQWLKCVRSGKIAAERSYPLRFADTGVIATPEALVTWALHENLSEKDVLRYFNSHKFVGTAQATQDAKTALTSALQQKPLATRKGEQMEEDQFNAAQRAQQELAAEEARTLEALRLIVEDYYTRGERLKPVGATLLTIEQAADAEKRGRASKPFSMAVHPAFGFSDRPVTFHAGQKGGRMAVVVPREAIVKLNDRYYYAVDYATMFNGIHGIVSYAEQVWENTKQINIAYGHLVKGIGHLASLGNNPLGQVMGPMMETAGEGMLYEVRKIEARKAGNEFTEEAPEIGWRTLVQGAANLAGNKAGGWSGKAVGKFAPRAAPVVGLAVGMETSTIITKGYEATQGNIEWSDVFKPDVSPVEMLVGLVEGAVLHKFSERWTKGRAPKVAPSETTPRTKASKAALPEPVPERVSGAKATTEGAAETAKPSGGKAPASFKPVGKGISATLDEARARWSKHNLEVTEEGLQLCSPRPCPLVRKVYQRELNQNEQLATLLDDIELQRRAKPKDAGLRNNSLALEEKLGEMKARNDLVGAIPEKEIANRARGIVDAGVGLDREQIEGFASAMAKQRSKAGRQRLVQTMEDVALQANAERNRARMRADPQIDREVEAAFTSGAAASKTAGKTSGSTAPKHDPTAQDVSPNIDEILPVGDKTVDIAERQRRALDLDNREFKEALTNQRTKHVKIDPRDLGRLKTTRKPVSLAMQETVKGKVRVKSGNEFGTLWSRRFSEIVEVKAIGERIVEDMQGKTTRRPGDLKAELNHRLWDEFKNPKSPEGRIVAEAISRSGFDIVQAPNGNNVLRALSQGELKARGLRYVEGQGWVKGGSSK